MFKCKTKCIMSKIKINRGDVVVYIDDKSLTKSLNAQLTNRQKTDLAIDLSDFHGAVDMSYIEDLLLNAAKMRLQAVKKNKDLYKNNKEYFNALKTIVQVKHTK